VVTLDTAHILKQAGITRTLTQTIIPVRRYTPKKRVPF